MKRVDRIRTTFLGACTYENVSQMAIVHVPVHIMYIISYHLVLKSFDSHESINNLIWLLRSPLCFYLLLSQKSLKYVRVTYTTEARKQFHLERNC